jgi:hypothetical protein
VYGSDKIIGKFGSVVFDTTLVVQHTHKASFSNVSIAI